MDIVNSADNEDFDFFSSALKLELKAENNDPTDNQPNYSGGPMAGQAPYPPQSAGQAFYPPQGGAPGPYPSQAGYPNQPAGPVPQQPGGPLPAGAVPPKGGMAPDPSKGETEVSAPPLEMMDQLPGYNNIGFEGTALPPPSYDEVTREEPQRENVQNAPTITEEDARQAILQFVSEHCCYGKGPAEEMKFNDLISSSAFRYTLETFGEARSTKWAHEPFTGQGISVTGPPPGPWDIQASTQLFKDGRLDVEVPNTASVKPCHKCNARGYNICCFCHGRGGHNCTSCNGSGRERYYEGGDYYHRDCTWCRGGWKNCITCNGSGQTVCNLCRGRGNLRWFIKLTILWTNHTDDFIVERTALPDELIKEVTGQIAFEETNQKVWPINHFPERDINAASNNLVTQHNSRYTNERILMQRHKVHIVPVTQVHYKYKDNDSSFFVYGFEHRVYAPDYPAQCCCGCSIL